MIKYVLKRILLLVPTLLAVVFIVFFIMNLTPSDPGTLILGESADAEAIAAKNEELGWNDPLLVRYGRYIWDAVHGDLGSSWKTGRSVVKEISTRMPVTMTLAAGSVVFGILFGISIGIISAVKQYSAIDMVSTVVALALASFPGFWVGMILIIVFSLKLGWLPAFGVGSLKHYILPWITNGCVFVASQMRMTRTSMLEAIRADYIRTARAKGQSEFKVIMHHALRNAMLPVVTMIGIQFGALLGGTVTVETVFSLPGVGMLIIESIRSKDVPLVLGATVMLSVCFTLVMVVVDIAYAFIDPRIKARYLRK